MGELIRKERGRPNIMVREDGSKVTTVFVQMSRSIQYFYGQDLTEADSAATRVRIDDLGVVHVALRDVLGEWAPEVPIGTNRTGRHRYVVRHEKTGQEICPLCDSHQPVQPGRPGQAPDRGTQRNVRELRKLVESLQREIQRQIDRIDDLMEENARLQQVIQDLRKPPGRGSAPELRSQL